MPSELRRGWARRAQRELDPPAFLLPSDSHTRPRSFQLWFPLCHGSAHISSSVEQCRVLSGRRWPSFSCPAPSGLILFLVQPSGSTRRTSAPHAATSHKTCLLAPFQTLFRLHSTSKATHHRRLRPLWPAGSGRRNSERSPRAPYDLACLTSLQFASRLHRPLWTRMVALLALLSLATAVSAAPSPMALSTLFKRDDQWFNGTAVGSDGPFCPSSLPSTPPDPDPSSSLLMSQNGRPSTLRPTRLPRGSPSRGSTRCVPLRRPACCPIRLSTPLGSSTRRAGCE